MKINKFQIIILSLAGFLFLISLGFYSIRQFGHLRLSGSITDVKKVYFLLHAIGDGNEYYFSTWVSLYPKEKKIGLYFINPLSKFPGEEVPLYKLKSGAIPTVEKKLENILGIRINYSITIKENNFKKIIDLIGGMPVYFEPKSTVPSNDYNRPSDGYYILDGRDAYEYLVTLESNTALDYVHRLERQESAVLNIFHKIIMDKSLIKKEWIGLFLKLLDTNLNSDEIYNLADFLLMEEIHFGISELPGDIQGSTTKGEYVLEVSNDTAKIAYTKFEDDLLSEFFADTERSRVEVLNGTNINGLARQGKSILNERRIKVLTVENAWTENFKETIVLNRSGNSRISKKVSDAIQKGKMFFSIRKELGLDVTVVLGEDFGKAKQ